MNIASPWTVQIAMLPVRRPAAVDHGVNGGRLAGIAKRKSLLKKHTDQVVEHLYRNPGSSAPQIAHALRIDRETARKILNTLKQEGRATTTLGYRAEWRMKHVN